MQTSYSMNIQVWLGRWQWWWDPHVSTSSFQFDAGWNWQTIDATGILLLQSHIHNNAFYYAHAAVSTTALNEETYRSGGECHLSTTQYLKLQVTYTFQFMCNDTVANTCYILQNIRFRKVSNSSSDLQSHCCWYNL